MCIYLELAFFQIKKKQSIEHHWYRESMTAFVTVMNHVHYVRKEVGLHSKIHSEIRPQSVVYSERTI